MEHRAEFETQTNWDELGQRFPANLKTTKFIKGLCTANQNRQFDPHRGLFRKTAHGETRLIMRIETIEKLVKLEEELIKNQRIFEVHTSMKLVEGRGNSPECIWWQIKIRHHNETITIIPEQELIKIEDSKADPSRIFLSQDELSQKLDEILQEIKTTSEAISQANRGDKTATDIEIAIAAREAVEEALGLPTACHKNPPFSQLETIRPSTVSPAIIDETFTDIDIEAHHAAKYIEWSMNGEEEDEPDLTHTR